MTAAHAVAVSHHIDVRPEDAEREITRMRAALQAIIAMTVDPKDHGRNTGTLTMARRVAISALSSGG